MQLRTYAKKNSISLSDAIEALKNNYPNDTFLLTTELTPKTTRFLEQTFGIGETPSLPPITERLQLPASNSQPVTPETNQLATTQPQALTTTEQPQQLNLDSSLTTTLINANLTADEMQIEQLLAAHNARVVSMVNGHNTQLQNSLLTSLQAKYAAIQATPKPEYLPSSTDTNLERFKALQAQLQEYQDATKS
ncbi:hypothetical protein NIES23_64280 (plasmid) [Trichormus variabilis NIES-23]|uniref:Uncharacterized protein n=1 Tax=Trichormus variabilis NIES-23 TaxID=1973479 RepID=A0A1Z4KX62_ANAVA|nr:hypothetical protein NIES23_64280 [Trichormus variabilis NIES-23]